MDVELDLSCVTTSYQVTSAFSAGENKVWGIKQEPKTADFTREYSEDHTSSSVPHEVKVEAAVKEENPNSPVVVLDDNHEPKQEDLDLGDGELDQEEKDGYWELEQEEEDSVQEEPEEEEPGSEVEEPDQEDLGFVEEEREGRKQDSGVDTQDTAETRPWQLFVILKSGQDLPETAASSSETNKKTVCYCLNGSCPNRPYAPVMRRPPVVQRQPPQIELVLPPDLVIKEPAMTEVGAERCGDSSQVSHFQTQENASQNQIKSCTIDSTESSGFSPSSKLKARYPSTGAVGSNNTIDPPLPERRVTEQNQTNHHLPPDTTESDHSLEDDWFKETKELYEMGSNLSLVYKCSACDAEFEEERERNEHFKLHIPEKRFMCHYCGLHLETNNQFTLHLEIHEPQDPVTCEICNETFGSKFRLDVHARQRHAARNFRCELCNKAFLKQCHLNRHLKFHKGSKDFLCSVCGQGFTERSDLKRHMGTHSELLPHPCPVCGKKFRTTSGLTQHMPFHTKKKAYKCSVCSKAFAYGSSYSLHMKSHSKNK